MFVSHCVFGHQGTLFTHIHIVPFILTSDFDIRWGTCIAISSASVNWHGHVRSTHVGTRARTTFVTILYAFLSIPKLCSQTQSVLQWSHRLCSVGWAGSLSHIYSREVTRASGGGEKLLCKRPSDRLACESHFPPREVLVQTGPIPRNTRSNSSFLHG